MRTPHLCHIIDSLGRGGTQQCLTTLVAGLQSLGYRQTVVSLNDDVDPRIARALGRNASVVVIGKSALLSIRGLVILCRHIRRADLVQTYLNYANILGPVCSRLMGVKLVVCSIRDRNIGKPPWQCLLDRLVTPLARRVIFNSRASIPFSLEREGVRLEQVCYIPNGIEIPPAAPSGETDQHIRGGLGLALGQPLIVSVGRLTEQKGHDLLLEAFARLPADLFPHLVIIGTGTGRPLLEELIRRLNLKNRVTLAGWQENVRAWLRQTDLFVLASRHEGMPNALLEAMAVGCPIVATAIDGNLELITSGTDGVLVPPEDVQALTEAMALLLRSPQRAKALGSAAVTKASALFSIDRMISAYAEIYGGLLREHEAAG